MSSRGGAWIIGWDVTLMIGAARVLFAMSRDHMMLPKLGRTHPQWGTPYRITVAIGVLVAIVAGVTPIGKLEEMVNIGTLAAFMLVSIAVPMLDGDRVRGVRPVRLPPLAGRAGAADRRADAPLTLP